MLINVFFLRNKNKFEKNGYNIESPFPIHNFIINSNSDLPHTPSHVSVHCSHEEVDVDEHAVGCNGGQMNPLSRSLAGEELSIDDDLPQGGLFLSVLAMR